MTQLSPHFSLEELTFSQKALRLGIDNTPPPEAVDNLTRLCETLLEPARMMLGIPLHVDSGYRCHELNDDVGGAIHSAHMEGRAADIIPIGMDLHAAFNALRRSTTLPFDEIIIECNAWIHIQIAPDGVAPRGTMLVASGGPGNWTYHPAA